ncbi:uncharacterized protein RHTO_07725 [Rhodotorula toruloides NP11]|uniref:Uncharacterized protein n=1 Tax=Rhodotorula toruloides (strain NP11) TaxID=1130832 RepID=M7WYD0_RHOT1|nr:uncharacterized protein RHTO_07725 [Rhodotorula toruloides NP11]EMS22855.1 hypothetical protein RHTO_07725 [Rhodotorula toruloides NP11]
MRIDGGARSGWDGGRQRFKSGLSSSSSLSLLHLTCSFPQPLPLSSPRHPPTRPPPLHPSLAPLPPSPSPSDSSSSASLPRRRPPRRPPSRTRASTASEVRQHWASRMDVVVEAIRRTSRSLDHLRLRKADAAELLRDRKAPPPTTSPARVGGLKTAREVEPSRRS